MLYRLGRFSFRRRRWVLGAWLALLVLVAVLGSTAGGSTTDTPTIPGTESQAAADLLDERFPAQSGSDALIVFAAADGTSFADPAQSAAARAVIAEAAAGPDVVSVSDPFTDGTVSAEQTVAYATVAYDTDAVDVPEEAIDALEATAATGQAAGLQVEFGGEVMSQQQESETQTSELIGLAVAVLVLLVSFGSVVAMGMPLVTALIGVGITVMSTALLANVVDLPSTTTTLATMIGLAVGIDYALFIITRHRQHLAEGFGPEEAAARATATAGGAVVFAGATVVIALAGLTVVGIPFIAWMGVGAAASVVVGIAVANTLVPALLGFAGHHIDRWRIGRARTGGHDEAKQTLSGRWAKRVTERPGVGLVAGLVVMLVLAIPTLSMRLGNVDDGSDPSSTTTRQAYDLLSSGFGPGFNGPLLLVADIGDDVDPTSALTDLHDAVAADPDVLEVGGTQVNPAGDTAVITVVPRSGPSSEDTSQLVHRLRDDVLPGVESASGVDVSVAGSTASNIDIADKLSGALPLFMLMVIGLTLLLLLAAFRSVLVPIKAALAILLSIGSSFGVLVAVFQWGWLKDLIGLHETVPIISFLPIMMFAILFGLSMDYEVFIMSRVREDYVRTGQARRSVLTGLTSSARVITAAALIMISVFGSFVLGVDPIIKMFGVGLSVAVLLDATVVRMLIVPSVMALLDRRAWWLPKWLDRALPDLDVEGEHLIASLGDGYPAAEPLDDGDGDDGDNMEPSPEQEPVLQPH